MELGLIWGHAPLGMGLDSAEAYATGVTLRGAVTIVGPQRRND
jgi:hypothetical protein